LLVPYLAWFLLSWVLAVLTPPLPDQDFDRALIDTIIGRGPSLWWYLYAAFICAVVTSMLASVKHSRYLLPLSAFAAVFWSSEVLVAVPDVLYLNSVVWVYPFVVLGYSLGPFRSGIPRYRSLIVALGMTTFVPLFLVRHPHPALRVPIIDSLTSAVAGAGGLSMSLTTQ